MISFPRRLFGAVVAVTLAAASPSFAQQLELKLMAPAAPGGGWDQTARSTRACPQWPVPDSCAAADNTLLDHLVGACEQRW